MIDHMMSSSNESSARALLPFVICMRAWRIYVSTEGCTVMFLSHFVFGFLVMVYWLTAYLRPHCATIVSSKALASATVVPGRQ